MEDLCKKCKMKEQSFDTDGNWYDPCYACGISGKNEAAEEFSCEEKLPEDFGNFPPAVKKAKKK